MQKFNKGLPLNERTMHEFGDAKDGLYRANDENTFAKVFNDLPNTRMRGMKLRTKLEAEAHAAFFKELQERGVYHPETVFVVTKSADDTPGVIAFMPKLENTHDDPSRAEKMREAVRSLLPKTKLHFDFNYDKYKHNFGADSSGNLYYHDLHVLDKTPNAAVIKWYAKLQRSRKQRA